MIFAVVLTDRDPDVPMGRGRWYASILHTHTGNFYYEMGGTSEQEMKEIVQRNHRGAFFLPQYQFNKLLFEAPW